jgi:hypothetical protein
MDIFQHILYSIVTNIYFSYRLILLIKLKTPPNNFYLNKYVLYLYAIYVYITYIPNCYKLNDTNPTDRNAIKLINYYLDVKADCLLQPQIF